MMKPESNESLSHVDEAGQVRMVDVSSKEPSERVATASAVVTMRPEVLAALMEGSLRKGEALTAAKLAGINGAKMTSRLVPLCHVVPI
jgi:cyclic pyranopterin phosphate synthase